MGMKPCAQPLFDGPERTGLGGSLDFRAQPDNTTQPAKLLVLRTLAVDVSNRMTCSYTT